MAVSDEQSGAQRAWPVEVTDGAMRAELRLGDGADERVDVACCAAAFADAGVYVDDEVRRRIAAALERGADRIVLEGQPAVNGEDGRLEWAKGMAPREPARPPGRAEGGAAETAAVDYYAYSRFVSVEAGQEIATLMEPTEGVDGQNVRGGVVEAGHGEAVGVELDEQTIRREPDGRCVARVTGVVRYDEKSLGVSDVLTIAEDVDFETGSVDVICPVRVEGAVRDRFSITTQRSLAVAGLVEAATIRTGGNFEANGGMAGKFRGRIDVGGDLTARYLNQVHGDIRGDAVVEREIIQCTLDIGGGLRMEKGTLISGRLSVTGEAVVREIGSDAEEPTVIELGIDRRFESCIAEADAAMRQLDRRLAEAKEQQQAIEAMGKADRLQRASELRKAKEAVDLLTQRREQIRSRRQRLAEGYAARRRVGLHVGKLVHRRTEVVTPDGRAELTASIKGPLWIGADEHGRLIVRDERAGRSMELEQFAKVSQRGPHVGNERRG